jgi:serine/threonine protein kinase
MVEDCESEASDDRVSFEAMQFIDPSELEVGEEIAVGGQAHVFLAVWNRVHKRPLPVVAKRLKGPVPSESNSSFWRQLRNVVGIGGMCLCGVLGVCVKDKAVYIVMERMLGDLRNFMNRTLIPFNWNDPSKYLYKLYMIWCIASGMEQLHRRGLFHRDLKASNVLFGILTEIDEDLARRMRPNHQDIEDSWTLSDINKLFFHVSIKVGDYESSEGVAGTGFWRAPEVLQQLKQDVTPVILTDKADVYSYVMLCYEILTGSIPFEGHRQSDYDLVLSGTRPELPAILSEGLRRLLESCWQTDPEQRPNFEQITWSLGHEFRVSCRERPGMSVQHQIYVHRRPKTPFNPFEDQELHFGLVGKSLRHFLLYNRFADRKLHFGLVGKSRHFHLMESKRREKPKIEGGAQEGVVVRVLDQGESDLNIRVSILEKRPFLPWIHKCWKKIVHNLFKQDRD